MGTDPLPRPADPIELDRRLASAVAHWHAWQRGLRQIGPAAGDELFLIRASASKSVWVEIENFPDAVPIKNHLLRWVYRLTEQRINERLISDIAQPRYGIEQPFDVPRRGKFTLIGAWQFALGEPPRLDAWLDSIGERSLALGEQSVLLWQRRDELARRLGVDSREALESPTATSLETQAESWLVRSQDLWSEFRFTTPGEVISTGLGAEADEGWPVQLTHQALSQWFRQGQLLEQVDLRPFDLPVPVAASSFARALERLGIHWHEAAAPATQPFCVAHDPWRLESHTLGAVFAGLLCNPLFAARELGLQRNALARHLRVLGRVLLVESRVRALKVLLRSRAGTAIERFRQTFQELSHRALGVAPNKALAGELWRLELEDLSRFAALFRGAQRGRALIDQHDQDWFRNPRALEQVRAEAELPPETTLTPEALEVAQLVLHRELTTLLTG